MSGVKTPEKTIVWPGVHRLVHGDVTPAVLTRTPFSISAGVFLFRSQFPAVTSDLEFTHVTLM